MRGNREGLNAIAVAWMGLRSPAIKRIPKSIRVPMQKFFQEKFELGTLCCRGHRHQGQAQSMRYVSNNQCYRCTLERNRKYRRQEEWQLARRKVAA